jgi:hypothetical protein
MHPYRKIAEDEQTITFEYNTAYTWMLYLLLGLAFYGVVSSNVMMSFIGYTLILVYFGLKLTLGKEVATSIKQALKYGSVVLSGNKHSFNNPLRIKVPKSS